MNVILNRNCPRQLLSRNQKNSKKKYYLKVILYKLMSLQCWGKPNVQKSIISVTKATEPLKMDQVTCHCLQGDMNYARLPVFVNRTFSHAETGGNMHTVNSFEVASKTCKSNSASLFGLLETGSICLFSQLWLLSTLDTALLTQRWETAHGCLKCASPQNLQSCEWFEQGWYSMWYAGTRFSATFNIIQQLHDRMDV